MAVARAPFPRPAAEAVARPARQGRRLYVPLAWKFGLVAAFALAWAGGSAFLAWPWIADLGRSITLPLAIMVVFGIAILPGYLNAHLIASILVDRPPPLERAETSAAPGLSIIVAAYNEEATIAETVRYALRQDYPGPFEVVVADDGSTDATAAIVEALMRDDPRIGLVRCPHGGKASALNGALATIASPLIATVDADTLLMPGSLRRCVARLMVSPPDTVAVAGSVRVRNSRANWLARMQEWDYFLGIASVKRQQALMRGTLVAQGAFSVYRTRAVREAGGWPDMIGEDIVLTWRLLEAGGRVGFESTAVAFTSAPTGFRHFVRQRRRWARGMIEGLRQHGPSLIRRRHMYSHAIAIDYAFPYMDLMYTVAFLPGVVLAATGNFAIVGPMTLAVLPLNALLSWFMFRGEARTFDALGLQVRRNRRGFVLYFLCYQAILSPVSLSGYLAEIARRRRRW